MMLLYICHQCGYWRDVTLAQMFSNALRIPALEEKGVICPEGHGAMVEVQADDRLQIVRIERSEQAWITLWKAIEKIQETDTTFMTKAGIKGCVFCDGFQHFDPERTFQHKPDCVTLTVQRLIEKEPEKRRQLDEREIYNVLRRLLKYYGDRANITGKHARECVDQQSMCDKAVAASRWEARRDAIVKVAENLGIKMENDDSIDWEKEQK